VKKEYFRSVLRHWGTIMVGTGSLVVSAISVFFSQKTYIIAFAVFGVSCLAASGYLTWRDERRKYLAGPFILLIDECEGILRFAQKLENPSPQEVFRPLSPKSFPEQIVLEEHKKMLRLYDRLCQHSERVNLVYETRRIDYPTTCSFDRWGENINSIDHGELLVMLRDHKKVLEQTRGKMLQAS
jgi:hypothetical protein